MFNITLKRSLATMAVVAGLLVAAGPASAAGVSTGHERTSAVNGKTNAGTQVGSEGVKAPSKAEPFFGGLGDDTLDVASSEVFELNTLGGNDTLAAPQGIIMSDGRICNPRWGC